MTSPVDSTCNSSYKERLQEFDRLLSADSISLSELQTSCFNGIPDEFSYRSLSWKVLLNYLPLRRSEWPEYLAKQRTAYHAYVEDLIVSPSLDNHENGFAHDHPLSTSPKSTWNEFFKDNEVLLQIDKDVRRLCPEISFYQQATEYPSEYVRSGRISSLAHRVSRTLLQTEVFIRNRAGGTNLSHKVAREEYAFLPGGQEAHWEVVERVLFIFYKLNPGIRYVQGMNELVGPIYYVLASDSKKEWREHAEADTFYCFQNLMSEVKDNFIKTLDNSNCGIEQTMSQFYEMFSQLDPTLHRHIAEEQELLPQYFAFRWIDSTLTFTKD